MITKLARELAGIDVDGDSPIVQGTNDLRPEEPGPSSMKSDMQGPFTDLVAGRHADSTQGQLGRAFGEYSKSVGDYQDTIRSHLNAKVREISGSSAASQAVARNRKAG